MKKVGSPNSMFELPTSVHMVALSLVDSNNLEQLVRKLNSIKPVEFLNKNSAKGQNTQFSSPETRVYSGYDDQTMIKRDFRKQKHYFSPEETSQLIDGYQNGKTIYELGKQFECHRDTISNHLKKHGVNVTIRKINNPEQLIELYAAGLTAEEIAVKFDVSKATILKNLRAHKVQMRKRWDY